MNPSHKKKERNVQILELRKKGKSFSQIGKLFGISRQRVHQVYLKTTSSELASKENIFESVLSERAKNGIRIFFAGTMPDPERIAGAGDDKLKMIDNIGSKSLKELANALHKHGYIGDPEIWLTGRKKD